MTVKRDIIENKAFWADRALREAKADLKPEVLRYLQVKTNLLKGISK